MLSEVIYVTTYDPALTHLGGAAYIDARQIAALRAAGMSVKLFSLTATGVPLEIRSDPYALSWTVARMVTRAEPYSLAKFKANRGWRAQAAALARLTRGAAHSIRRHEPDTRARARDRGWAYAGRPSRPQR